MKAKKVLGDKYIKTNLLEITIPHGNASIKYTSMLSDFVRERCECCCYYFVSPIFLAIFPYSPDQYASSQLPNLKRVQHSRFAAFCYTSASVQVLFRIYYLRMQINDMEISVQDHKKTENCICRRLWLIYSSVHPPFQFPFRFCS